MQSKYTWLFLLLEPITMLKLQIYLYVQMGLFGLQTAKLINVIALSQQLCAFTKECVYKL